MSTLARTFDRYIASLKKACPSPYIEREIRAAAAAVRGTCVYARATSGARGNRARACHCAHGSNLTYFNGLAKKDT